MNFLDKTGLAYLWNKIKSLVNTKQDKLVSGSNIKTINGNSLLGEGNITIEGSGSESGEGITFYDLTEIIPSIDTTTFDLSVDAEYVYTIDNINTLTTLQYIADTLAPAEICGIKYYGNVNGMDVMAKLVKTQMNSGLFNTMYVEYNGTPIPLSDAMQLPEEELANVYGCLANNMCSFFAVDMGYVDSSYKPFVLNLKLIPLSPFTTGFDIYESTSVKMIIKKIACDESNGGSSAERIIIYENSAGLSLATTIGSAVTFNGIDIGGQDYSNYELNVYVGWTAYDGTNRYGYQKFTYDLANYEILRTVYVNCLVPFTGGTTNDGLYIVAQITDLDSTTWSWKPNVSKKITTSIANYTTNLNQFRLFKVELVRKG